MPERVGDGNEIVVGVVLVRLGVTQRVGLAEQFVVQTVRERRGGCRGGIRRPRDPNLVSDGVVGVGR